jgi:tetratricopeptide (TPR) repeat protein
MPRVLVILVALILAAPAATWAQTPGRTNPNAELARGHYLRGWEFMRAESFEDAVQQFKQAIELEPNYAIAHYSLGRAHMALKQYSDAVRALSACQEIYAAAAGRKFQGQLDANRQRQDRLLELQDMRMQVGKGPQSGQTQDMARQLDNAIRLTQEAFDRGMNISIEQAVPAFVSLSLGSAYFRSEQFDQAERHYREAINADSKAGEAHNNLAVVLMMKAQYADALAELKAAEKAGFRVNPELKDQIKSRMAQ